MSIELYWTDGCARSSCGTYFWQIHLNAIWKSSLGLCHSGNQHAALLVFSAVVLVGRAGPLLSYPCLGVPWVGPAHDRFSPWVFSASGQLEGTQSYLLTLNSVFGTKMLWQGSWAGVSLSSLGRTNQSQSLSSNIIFLLVTCALAFDLVVLEQTCIWGTSGLQAMWMSLSTLTPHQYCLRTRQNLKRQLEKTLWFCTKVKLYHH